MSTVVESKIGKNFSKSMGRAKEKILQNLGKVDRTADEIFDDHVSNFNKQQFAATRLQKELNNYIRCIRACAAANKSLLEAVTDVYEPEWGDKDTLSVNTQQVEMLWNDFAHRLAEQVLIPLNTYQGQFPEMRKKIEKRGRKLVDFDGERHALQALQSNPRRAEAKLSRQRENLEAAKRTYEVLNSELHEELPGLYGSRIVFLVSAMSTLFASENIFHSESAKIFQEFEGVVERLAKESAKGTLNFKSSNNAILNNRDSMKDDSKGERSTPTTPTVKTTKQVVAELGGFDNDNEAASIPPHRPPPVTPIKKGLKNHISSSSVAPSTSAEPPSDLSLSNNATTPDKRATPDLDSIKTTNPADTEMVTASEASSPAKHVANGESEEKAEATAVAVNGGALPAKDNPTTTVVSSIEAEASIAVIAATTTATAAEAHDKKHEHQNHGQINGNGDDTDESKHDVVEMPMSASITTNGDRHKLNGRHSSGDSHPTREHDEETEKAEAHRAESVKTPEKIISNRISANENAVVKPASPTNNHSTSNSNATTPATEIPKEEKGVLYRVRATYRYQKEDDDELSFDAGEIIRVIEYDDPEEQEEGWLMGVKDNGEKGMFPANFTRPI